VYHLCAKDFYTRIGKEDLGYHRVHSIEFIATRLVQLDFIIANQQYDYLETENQKVSYFSEALGISKSSSSISGFSPRWMSGRFGSCDRCGLSTKPAT
jgi:hypothetical protein